jgi:hypothetical protein
MSPARRIFEVAVRSHLLSSEADPEDPLNLADLLATRWSLDVHARRTELTLDDHTPVRPMRRQAAAASTQ